MLFERSHIKIRIRHSARREGAKKGNIQLVREHFELFCNDVKVD
jgi:hypothetical protein